jgi:hypothetical protein
MSKTRVTWLAMSSWAKLTPIVLASCLASGCAPEPPSPRNIEALLASAEQVHIDIQFPAHVAAHFGVRNTKFSITSAAEIKRLSESFDIETVPRRPGFGRIGTNMVIEIRISRGEQEDVSWQLFGTDSLYFFWEGNRYEARVSASFFDRIMEYATANQPEG